MRSATVYCFTAVVCLTLAGCPATLDTSCTPGQTSCEGTSLKTCTTAGTWFIGACGTGLSCQNGQCVSTSTGQCGDSQCDASLNETCSTCPADCGQCCGDSNCTTGIGENCSTCPTDCGQCCGNGICDGEFSETPTSCPADCKTENCNNGTLDTGEACDGVNLNGKTCADVGFAEGTLTCAADCSFDTSACIEGPTSWALAIESTNENPTVRALASDTQGNIYVAGLFSGQLTGLGSPIMAKGTYDYWVAKLDSDGKLLWLTTNGEAGAIAGIKGVVVDSLGSVYVTGFFQGAFVTTGLVVESKENQSFFVVKLNSDGTVGWQATHVPPTVGNIAGEVISLDGNSNVIVAGTYSGSINLGGVSRTAVGLNDTFIMAANRNTSAFGWATELKAESFSSVSPTAIASEGDETFVVGRYTGKVSGDGKTASAEGGSDILLTKVKNGTVEWISTYGGTGYDGARALALDGAGYAYVGGYFQDTASFGLAASNDLKSKGDDDGFVFKVNLATDAVSWTTSVGGTGADNIHALATTKSGIHMGGLYSGNVTIGSTNVSAVDQGAFAAPLDASGTLGATTSFSNSSKAAVDQATLLPDGSVVLIGTFSGPMTIEGNAITSAGTGQAHFLTRLVP